MCFLIFRWSYFTYAEFVKEFQGNSGFCIWGLLLRLGWAEKGVRSANPSGNSSTARAGGITLDQLLTALS